MRSYAYGSDGHPDIASYHEIGKPSAGCGCSGCELLRDGAAVDERRQDAEELYQQCAESNHQLSMCSQCYPSVDPPDIDLHDSQVPW